MATKAQVVADLKQALHRECALLGELKELRAERESGIAALREADRQNTALRHHVRSLEEELESGRGHDGPDYKPLARDLLNLVSTMGKTILKSE